MLLKQPLDKSLRWDLTVWSSKEEIQLFGASFLLYFLKWSDFSGLLVYTKRFLTIDLFLASGSNHGLLEAFSFTYLNSLNKYVWLFRFIPLLFSVDLGCSKPLFPWKNSAGYARESNISNKEDYRLVGSSFRQQTSLTCEGQNETATRYRIFRVP